MLVARMMTHPHPPSGGTSLTLLGFPIGGSFPFGVSLPFLAPSRSLAIFLYRESLSRA